MTAHPRHPKSEVNSQDSDRSPTGQRMAGRSDDAPFGLCARAAPHASASRELDRYLAAQLDRAVRAPQPGTRHPQLLMPPGFTAKRYATAPQPRAVLARGLAPAAPHVYNASRNEHAANGGGILTKIDRYDALLAELGEDCSKECDGVAPCEMDQSVGESDDSPPAPAAAPPQTDPAAPAVPDEPTGEGETAVTLQARAEENRRKLANMRARLPR